MSPSRLFVRPVVAALAAVSLLSAGGAQADTTLLNVSYDVARELYKEINPAFVAHWQRSNMVEVAVAEQDMVDAQHLLDGQVAHAGTSIDQDVLIEQKRGGAASLSNRP